jgi:geranylgeranyl reductase family protein
VDADVVVVGAGPAGSTVSAYLAQFGYAVVLVDRATFPRDKACAEYLSPACSPILARLGVLDAVLAAAPQRLHGMRITDYRGRSCVGRFLAADTEGLALPRCIFDTLLVQHAASLGVSVRTGVWIRHVLVRDQHVYGVSGLCDGKLFTVQARLVIAADGLHSTLGRRLGVIRRVRRLQHVALVTHYAQVDNPQPCGEMFLIPFGYIGLAPVGPEVMNVSLVMRTTQFGKAHGTREQVLERALSAHPELRQRFTHATRLKPILSLGPMAQRTLRPHHTGILFIGDAAGFFDPFTGQGIFLALYSAQLAAAAAHRILQSGDTSGWHARRYFQTYQQTYGEKRRVSELIQLGLRLPPLANHVINRLAQQPTLAHTLVGVTGDVLPPGAVLSWRFARRLLC